MMVQTSDTCGGRPGRAYQEVRTARHKATGARIAGACCQDRFPLSAGWSPLLLLLPAQARLAEVPIVRRLPVNRLPKREPLDHRRRTVVEGAHQLLRGALVAGAERVHTHRHGFGTADRVRNLDLRA